MNNRIPSLIPIVLWSAVGALIWALLILGIIAVL
jgi:hypothetical protein